MTYSGKETNGQVNAAHKTCGRECGEEEQRLARLLSRATRRAERWKSKAMELSRREIFLAAEQSAQILGVAPYMVRELCDRHGLRYMLISNRRFYRERDIESLKKDLLRQAGPG